MPSRHDVTSEQLFDAITRLSELELETEEDASAVAVAVIALKRVLRYRNHGRRTAERIRSQMQDDAEYAQYIREKRHRQYLAEKEHRQDYGRQYYQENKEKIKARSREYYRKNFSKSVGEKNAER